MKKVLSLVLALVMVLGMVSFASAATITVANNDPNTDTNTTGETYVAYKIFDAVKATGTTITTSGTTQTASGPITYRIAKDSKWFSVLFNNDGTAKDSAQKWFTATKIDGVTPETWQVNPTAETEALTDAKDIANWLLANKPSDAPATSLTTPAKGAAEASTTVDDGYYLVTSTLGTNLGLATTDMPMTVVEKNTYPSVDKTQNDTSATAEYKDDKVNIQVGDTIYYKVSVVVPNTAKGTITLTDTMSAGLTPAAASTITAKIGETVLAATTGEDPDVVTNWTANNGTSPATYTITIPVNANTLGKTIDFYMTGVVNDSAIVTDTARKNEVELVYSNYKQTDYVEYTIYATGAVKYDGDTATASEGVLTAKEGKAIKYLQNAEFKLQVQEKKTGDYADLAVVKDGADYGRYRVAKSDETGVTIVSDTNGQIIIRGLDTDDNYQLVETKAPDGYNLLTSPASLKLTEDTKAKVSIDNGEEEDTTYLTAANVAKIENNQGSVLPSTGGIGTTIFYVLGSVMALGALVLLVTKRRVNVQ